MGDYHITSRDMVGNRNGISGKVLELIIIIMIKNQELLLSGFVQRFGKEVIFFCWLCGNVKNPRAEKVARWCFQWANWEPRNVS